MISNFTKMILRVNTNLNAFKTHTIRVCAVNEFPNAIILRV
jgi:hypothetical protein